jgi:class 3 adenylate cyclase
VLSDVIGRINPGFLQRFDRANVIGYDRPWTNDGGTGHGFEPEVRSCCVLKADVYGYGSLMRAGTDGPVREAMEEAVRKWAPPSAMCKVEAGDSAVIADDDPIALAQAARHLVDEVYAAPGQPRLRVALHYGEVQVRQRHGDGGELISGGSAVLCAARVEPFVEPGQIWATEDFRQKLMERPSLWRTIDIEPPASTVPKGESFNVKKPGSDEPDLLVRLYRLQF